MSTLNLDLVTPSHTRTYFPIKEKVVRVDVWGNVLTGVWSDVQAVCEVVC